MEKDFIKSFDLSSSREEGIEKAYNFLFGDELEKAVYADTAENRKLGRVGQEYHRGRKKTATVNDTRGGKVKKTEDTTTELKNGDVNDDLTKIWNKKKGDWEDSLVVYKQDGKWDVDDIHYDSNNPDIKYAKEVGKKIENRAEELYKENMKN